jgi:hypothetical protein
MSDPTTAGDPPDSNNTDAYTAIQDVVTTERRIGLTNAKGVAVANGDTDTATALQAEIDALT